MVNPKQHIDSSCLAAAQPQRIVLAAARDALHETEQTRRKLTAAHTYAQQVSAKLRTLQSETVTAVQHFWISRVNTTLVDNLTCTRRLADALAEFVQTYDRLLTAELDLQDRLARKTTKLQAARDRLAALENAIIAAPHLLPHLTPAQFEVAALENSVTQLQRQLQNLQQQTAATYDTLRHALRGIGFTPKPGIHAAGGSVVTHQHQSADLEYYALAVTVLGARGATEFFAEDTSFAAVRARAACDMRLADDPHAEQDARSAAASRFFEFASQYPEAAFVLLGFDLRRTRFTDFKADISALRKQLRRQSVGGSGRLLRLGRHRDQLTAVVAWGESENPKKIITVVPGMGSSVADVGSINKALAELCYTHPDGGEVMRVAWLGYDSPNIIEEPGVVHAAAGAARLTADISALQSTYPEARFTVIAHSYGSTTAAVALGQLSKPVANFITIGSAGLAPETTREQIKAGRVYAATADPHPRNWFAQEQKTNTAPQPKPVSPHTRRALRLAAAVNASDRVAPIGRVLGAHPVDPRNIPGVTELQVNSVLKQRLKPVGTHSLYIDRDVPESLRNGYLNTGTQSAQQIARIIWGQKGPL